MINIQKQRLIDIKQLWISGEHAAALALYKNLSTRFPDDALVWREYGRALFAEQSDEEQAIAVFERAQWLNPDSAITLLYLGALYDTGYGKGYPEALKVYRYILNLAPTDEKICIDAYLGLGLLYLGAPGVPANLQKALEMFRNAAALDPENWRIHENLGLIFYQNLDLQHAREEFKLAEQLCERAGESTESVQKYLQRLDHGEPFRGGAYCGPVIVWEWPNRPIE